MYDEIDLEYLQPLEVDDEFILQDKVLPQRNKTSLTSGFNACSRLYYFAQSIILSISAIWALLNRQSLPAFDPSKNIEILRDGLHKLKYMLDDLPPELCPWSSYYNDNITSNQTRYTAEPIHAFATMAANMYALESFLFFY